LPSRWLRHSPRDTFLLFFPWGPLLFSGIRHFVGCPVSWLSPPGNHGSVSCSSPPINSRLVVVPRLPGLVSCVVFYCSFPIPPLFDSSGIIPFLPVSSSGLFFSYLRWVARVHTPLTPTGGACPSLFLPPVRFFFPPGFVGRVHSPGPLPFLWGGPLKGL